MSLSTFANELIALIARIAPSLSDDGLELLTVIASREKQRRLTAGAAHFEAQQAVDAALGGQ